MSQTYSLPQGTDSLKSSRGAYNSALDALLTQFAGTSFPTVASIGQPCYRTDLGKLYLCTSIGPNVWGNMPTLADADGRYMLGDAGNNKNLIITKAWPAIVLDKIAANQGNEIRGKLNGVDRWLVRFGTDEAESGANAGSNFSVYRFADDGTYLDAPLSISRKTGQVSLTARPTWSGYVPWDNNNFNPSLYALLTGGTFTGDITVRRGTANTGAVYFGNGNAYIYHDGTNFSFGGGGSVFINSMTVQSGAPQINMSDTDWGTRYIHFNDGNIGFLNNGAGWVWKSRNDGSTWQSGTAYIGSAIVGTDGNLYLAYRGQWLNAYLDYIEGRANTGVGNADDRVHRIMFSGYGEVGGTDGNMHGNTPNVFFSARGTAYGAQVFGVRTLMMHIPSQGGWVNVWG